MRITRKMLDNYRKTKREIPVLELELSEMFQGDNGFGSSVILDYRKGYAQPCGIVGFDDVLYAHRKKVLAEKEATCKAVEEWIAGIEDGQTRYVFRMFYQEGMSWEKIANKIGYKNNPDYPRLMIRDRFLKECKLK